MASNFTFNGVNSTTHKLKCKEINHFTFSSKSYESIKVHGRTGTLLVDDGSYENKVIPITAYLDLRKVEDKKTVVNNIKKWLIGHTGYKTLTFDDTVEYQAIVSGEITFKEIFTDYYEIEINFECVEVIE